MMRWPWSRKKKEGKKPAQAPASPTPEDGQRDDDTKVIQTRFAESEKAVEEAKKGLKEKVTGVKKKADDCVRKMEDLRK